MAKSAKSKKEEVLETVTDQPEPVVESTPETVKTIEEITTEVFPQETPAEVTEEIKYEVVEVIPEAKEIKEADEVSFLFSILEFQENGGWGKHLHPMIKARIEHLRK